jgi:hypothetical protein
MSENTSWIEKILAITKEKEVNGLYKDIKDEAEEI